MNKMQKVVGASVIGALALMPAGTVFATRTAANVDNFFTMPIIITRMNYYENFFGLILKKRATYLNMVALDPNYTEQYADENYEALESGKVDWGRTIFSTEVDGILENEEIHLMARDGFTFYSDEIGLIYYAVTFMDGSKYTGKISYAPCVGYFDHSATDASHECRIYYNEGRATVSAEDGGTYMSAATAAKYTGGDEVLTSYAYRVEPKSEPLSGLPADVKTMEQKIAEWQGSGGTQSGGEDQSQSAEIERLNTEIAKREAALANETARWEAVLAEETAKWEAELAQKEAELTQKKEELAQKQTELDQKKEELIQKQAELAQKQEELAQKEAELAQKETEWQTQIAEQQAELVRREAELSAEIEELKQELATLEKEQADKMAEIAVLKADLADLEAAKKEEIAALEQKLAETETILAAERKVWEAKLTELAEKTETEPIVQKIYTEKEVAEKTAVGGERNVSSEEAAENGDVTGGTENEGMTDGTENGDATDDAAIAETAEMPKGTPELYKEEAKPWWVLAPIAAAVGGLSYWWIRSSFKHKRKK